LTVNHLGQIIGWGWMPANAHDTWFNPLLEAFEGHSVIFGDTGFHAKEGDPPNLKVCQRGERNERMLVETVYSMLTVVCHMKKVRHQVLGYFQSHLGIRSFKIRNSAALDRSSLTGQTAFGRVGCLVVCG